MSKMKNDTEKTLFAFKLAAKKAETIQRETQWKARENVSTAGCTGFPAERYVTRLGSDNGVYC